MLHEQLIASYLASFSPTVMQMLHVRSLEEEYAYLQSRISRPTYERNFFFCLMNGATCIGALEIRDPAIHAGQLYCWLHESVWGKGYLQWAFTISAAWYFIMTQESFITAHVDMNNWRSHQALKKCGFSDAGIIHGPHEKQYQLIYRNK
jgi:RimJ/RimL family protein N-acetyltransferase